MAANATFALKPGVWFLRVRFVIFAPDSRREPSPPSGRKSTQPTVQILEASSLHTWGQNLLHHPHLHCLVPGGGVSPGGDRWMACRPGFFLPVTVLSRLFRGLFLHYLEAAFTAGRLHFFSTLQPLAEPCAFR